MIRRLPILAGFTFLYMGVFLTVAAVQGNKEFLLYGASMIAIIGAVIWADTNARFSVPVLWMLSIWGLLHMAGGNVPIGQTDDGRVNVLYNLWLVSDLLKYDKLVHFFGFLVTSLALYEALRPLLRDDAPPRLAVFTIVASASMGLGALNEVIEFIAVKTIPDTNVGGYDNTGGDLIANTLGAVLAGGWLMWRSQRRGRLVDKAFLPPQGRREGA